MSLKDAQQKLSTDIASLYETYQLISKNKHQFNELDVALLQQQLLYVYHSLLRVQSQMAALPAAPQAVEELLPLAGLKHEPDEVLPPVEPEKPQVVVAEETQAEPVIEETVEITEELAPVVIEAPLNLTLDFENSVSKLNEITDNEPTLDDLEKLMEEKENQTVTAETPKIEEQTVVVQTAVTTLEDSAVVPVQEVSVLDKLSAGLRTPDVYEKITKTQQQSLKQAINLNKKIAFVNNLFNENTVEYAKAIEKLNASNSLHEALRYFNELKHQYNWNNENALVKDLEQLIEKRFS
ncbi:MAG: hypothetical protein ACK5UI_08020 [Bacteroidota bacterium]|jgi:hypothetical protein